MELQVGQIGIDTDRRFRQDTAAELRAWGALFAVKYVCQRNALTENKLWHADEYDACLAAGVEPVAVNEWYTAHNSTRVPKVGSILRYGTDAAALKRAAGEDFAAGLQVLNEATPHLERRGLLGYAEDEDFHGAGFSEDLAVYGGEMQRLQRAHTDCPFFIYTGGRGVRWYHDNAGRAAELGLDVAGVAWWWQASAWSRRLPEPESHILQTTQHDVGGIRVDLNTVVRPYSTTPTPKDDDMAPIIIHDETTEDGPGRAQYLVTADARKVHLNGWQYQVLTDAGATSRGYPAEYIANIPDSVDSSVDAAVRAALAAVPTAVSRTLNGGRLTFAPPAV